LRTSLARKRVKVPPGPGGKTIRTRHKVVISRRGLSAKESGSQGWGWGSKLGSKDVENVLEKQQVEQKGEKTGQDQDRNGKAAGRKNRKESASPRAKEKALRTLPKPLKKSVKRATVRKEDKLSFKITRKKPQEVINNGLNPEQKKSGVIPSQCDGQETRQVPKAERRASLRLAKDPEARLPLPRKRSRGAGKTGAGGEERRPAKCLKNGGKSLDEQKKSGGHR